MTGAEFRAGGTSALIVVDVQAGTLSNAKTLPGDTLVDRVARIADRFRAAGRPVFFAVSTGTPAGATTYGAGGRTWPDGFDVLDPRLARRPAEGIFARPGWSAFARTGLDDELRRSGVTDVVVAGLASSFGVESTARAAYDLGYSVHVVVDAISDPSEAAHAHFVARVVPALGVAVKTDDVLTA